MPRVYRGYNSWISLCIDAMLHHTLQRGLPMALASLNDIGSSHTAFYKNQVAFSTVTLYLYFASIHEPKSSLSLSFTAI